MKKISHYLPITSWLPHYKKAYLKGDISAGLTVGIMLIPQGMAYAAIAGLPLIYGLYAALIPQVIYAIFGTSRQLAVGAVATDALLVASGLSLFAEAGTEEYIHLAILLSFMVGVIQLSFGLIKLGFLVNFLSKPVINGFVSAAGIIIALSQIEHLLGVDVTRSSQIQYLAVDVFSKLEHIHWLSFAIGSVGILVIYFMKKLNKRFKVAIPASLIVVVLGILSVWLFRLDEQGVRIIKNIPSGLPHFAPPKLAWRDVLDLLPIAFTVALIAYVEAIAIAKSFQSKHKDHYIYSNQELIALGLAHLFGSFFKSFPVSGGFSRTAVNDQAGARTQLASFISASIVALTLLVLTPLFYYLPKAVLASIIITAVVRLVDIKYPIFLWQNKKEEFFMLLPTFIVTLTVGITEGVLLGVLVSLAIVIYQTTRPHVAILGRFQGTSEYRNVERFADVRQREDILILRYDASLYFANAENFKDTIEREVAKKGDKLRLLILNTESINTVDSSALETVRDVYSTLAKLSILVFFTGVKGPIRDIFYKTKLTSFVGEEHFFLDIQQAVDFFDEKDSDWIKASITHANQSNRT